MKHTKPGDIFISTLGSETTHYVVTDATKINVTIQQIKHPQQPNNTTGPRKRRTLHKDQTGTTWIALTCYQTASLLEPSEQRAIEQCQGCSEPLCTTHNQHWADCPCPGHHEE
jgi:hypothetical protein